VWIGFAGLYAIWQKKIRGVHNTDNPFPPVLPQLQRHAKHIKSRLKAADILFSCRGLKI